MKKHTQLFAVLLLALGGLVATGLVARASAQDQQQPPSQQQPPQRQAPDQAQPPDAQQTGQTFTGTIVKSGEKYVLQSDAGGNTYDVDHQTEVKKFEGKKVRIHGTLDPNGKLIHIQ